MPGQGDRRFASRLALVVAGVLWAAHAGAQSLPGPGHASALVPQPQAAPLLLLLGGEGAGGVPVTSAWLYAADGTPLAVGDLTFARRDHAATALGGGRVVVTGGSDGTALVAALELVDVTSAGVASAASAARLIAPRQWHRAVRLMDGRVLIQGGYDVAWNEVYVDEVYDPATDTIAVADPGLEYAAVFTDRPDYFPGETVYVTGGRWNPDEDVYLLFDEDPLPRLPRLLTVTADSNGQLKNVATLLVEPTDLQRAFTLHAVGAQSGASADAHFTDANSIDVQTPAGPAVVEQGRPFQITVSIVNGSNNKPVDSATMALSGATGLGCAAVPPNPKAVPVSATTTWTFSCAASSGGTFTVGADATFTCPPNGGSCSTANGPGRWKGPSTLQVTVVAPPALVVKNLAPASRITTPGAAISFTADVQNTGGGTANGVTLAGTIGSVACTGASAGAIPGGSTAAGVVLSCTAPTTAGSYTASVSASGTDALTGGAVSSTGNPSALVTVAAPSSPLDVTIAGNGTVSSIGSAVARCGAPGGVCSDPNVVNGTTVTLTAVAGAGASFTGWSGGGCSGTGACVLTIQSAQSVTATFADDQPLTVDVDPGHAGVSCNGAACNPTYPFGVPVTISVAPAAGITFDAFTGDCTGQTCTVTMTQPRAVGAALSAALTVEPPLHGAITCGGGSCGATLPLGSSLTLTAVADPGYDLAAWSGACADAGPASSCSVTVGGPLTVGATFAAHPYTLTVKALQHGGITCGGQACPTTLAYGQDVRLDAAPQQGYAFAYWTDDCEATSSSPCTVHVTKDVTVGAVFALQQHAVGLTVTGPGSVACDDGNFPAKTVSCTDPYPYGTTLHLVASGNTGSGFDGWSGACSGTTDCTLTLDSDKAVTATFSILSEALVIDVQGTGKGGVLCDGGPCQARYDWGRSVTLSYVADVSSTFGGWSPPCAPMADACTVVLNAPTTTVSATFDLKRLAFTSSPSGDGKLTCNDVDCLGQYPYNAQVKVTAVPSVGSVFGGWDAAGPCAGKGNPCQLTITSDVTLAPAFVVQPQELTIGQIVGSGTLLCDGGTCAPTYPANSTVTVQAKPGPGYVFASWSGACIGVQGTTCSVRFDADRTVGATFAIDPAAAVRTLQVTPSGAGRGAVTATFAGGGDTGLACASGSSIGCSVTVPASSVVTLKAAPSAGSIFYTWNLPCIGFASTCTLTMTGSANVGAQFQPSTYPLTASTSAMKGTAGGTVTLTFDDGTPAVSTTSKAVVNVPNPGLTAPLHTVTLVARPDASSVFTGWSGARCSGTAACMVTMSLANAVTATFQPSQFKLTAQLFGGGKGTVTAPGIGASPGIGCSTGSTAGCSMQVPNTIPTATSVTLRASTTDPGSIFAGWSGPCATTTSDGSGGTCTLPVAQATTVSASFQPRFYTLTVTLSGSGRGTIGNVSGMTCTTGWPQTCTASIPNTTPATPVSVTATATTGRISGWSSPCSGSTAGSCSFPMAGPLTMGVSFQ